MNLSIKNYQLKEHKNISLHSGNLLRLIQDYPIFINHFLNITTGFPSYGPKLRREHSGPVSLSDIDEAQRIMRLTVITKAFAGGVTAVGSQGAFKTQQANYFVLNDSSSYSAKSKNSNHFYVIPINTAINSILKNSKDGEYKFDVKYGNRKELMVSSNFQGSKPNYSAAWKRIRKMVIDLGRRSVSVEMSKSALRRLEVQ